MTVQTATTGQLEDAQRIAIAEARFTAEHNMPMLGLIERMTLPKGHKSITVPKVAQMTANSLADGVDLTDTEDIGMTTTSLTTGEIGLKVILTDKLIRQESEDPMRIVGRQMGDAMARKKNSDVLALFSGFSTDLGAAGRQLELSNLVPIITYAKANKFPMPIAFVHHPWALYEVGRSVTTGTPSNAALSTIPDGFSADMLKDFFNFTINKVPVVEDGNITEDASGDGVGAIFSKNALVYVESVGFNTERERDASMRATELIITADYGVFELDDSYGAACTFNVAAIATA